MGFTKTEITFGVMFGILLVCIMIVPGMIEQIELLKCEDITTLCGAEKCRAINSDIDQDYFLKKYENCIKIEEIKNGVE